MKLFCFYSLNISCRYINEIRAILPAILAAGTLLLIFPLGTEAPQAGARAMPRLGTVTVLKFGQPKSITARERTFAYSPEFMLSPRLLFLQMKKHVA
jgi:hypothetical protein